MINPQVVVKANYNRTLVTVRVSAINSPDWVDIVGTRIDLAYDANFADVFYSNATTHYKVRAYLEHGTPNQTVYARVTLTKDDNTTLVYTFNFVVPYPILGTIKDDNGTQYVTSIRKMDKNGNLSSRNYSNTAIVNSLPYIDIMADAAGEMVISNQWDTAITVENITQGTVQATVASLGHTSVAVAQGDVVRISEGAADCFRHFTSHTDPLCKGVSAHVIGMPAMNKFTKTDAGVETNSFFFYGFNKNGTISSFPEGSFDTHKIVTFGTQPFYQFNNSGALTALPEGSFDTSNLTSLPTAAFNEFNSSGIITSLPEGSFDFENVTSIGGGFGSFNYNGALTSLPAGSFGFSSASTASGTQFCSSFNASGTLTSLPAGAFHFKKNSVCNGFVAFSNFNNGGSLASLPEYSFNFIIQPSSTNMFTGFNRNGALTSLPAGSFHFDPTITTLATAFNSFNSHGALTSLPVGSFNTENLTLVVAMDAFGDFNNSGALTSLPVGSFNFDGITEVRAQKFLADFNAHGALKTLPRGSFSLKNLTALNVGTAQSFFIINFNYGGQLEYLPVDAFSVSSAVVTSNGDEFDGFNGDNGHLIESNTDYNPDFVNIDSVAKTAYYYDAGTSSSYSNSIAVGNPFKYYQADYFNVTYNAASTFTTNIQSSYLSGQTITFTAEAVDPAYQVSATITTSGGTTVTVIENGDDTFTFKMPQDDITVNFTVVLRPATITLVAEEAGTMVITNKWTMPVSVRNATQGTAPVTVAANSSTNVSVVLDDEVTVTEGSSNVTFRQWQSGVTAGFATGVLCRIEHMPDMTRFTTNATGQTANHYFFEYFCAGNNGKGITSLPAGSFDTSAIYHYYFDAFTGFNKNGLLTSLPAGSFDLSATTDVSGDFCEYFNANGALTSLPVGSFNTSNITQPAGTFFAYFNQNGALTSLPAGSFDISNIHSAGENFFAWFNQNGALTSLPAGSFDTSGITYCSFGFFNGFNKNGALTSLPAGSFDISGFTTIPLSNFFNDFNYGGALTSLPAGSFDTSNLTNLESYCFKNFNRNGALTSLPAGSFDLSGITGEIYGFDDFANFNMGGALTSLPAGSFDISGITGIRINSPGFFASFNNGGSLTSLPAGSFDTSNITSIQSGSFFSAFNKNGALTSLPAGSFNTDNVVTLTQSGFFQEFNSGGELTSLPTGSFGTANITGGQSVLYQFNNGGGKLPKDTTAGNYNPNCINTSSVAETEYYWNGSSSVSESVAVGAPFYYKTA